MKMRTQLSMSRRTHLRWIAATLLLVAGAINTLWTYSFDATRKTTKLAALLVPSRSTSSLSPERMVQIGADLGRTFPLHHNLTWCTKEGYHDKKRDKSKKYFWKEPPKGLLYVKVPKAASSTAASVVHRISRNHGDCDFRAQHTSPAGHFYGNRNKSASFLLGSVRDPAARAISRIFFTKVSRYGETPTDSNVFKWLNNTNGQFGAVSKGQGGFQLRYMSIDPVPEPWSVWNPDNLLAVKTEQVHDHVREVVSAYDFLLVVERMDESLVVLQMLLGVHIGDMLTLDSKVQGMYTYLFGDSKRGCFENIKATVSPVVKEYLSSDTWYAQNYGDYVLHAAANASLDRTIEVLGRRKVDEAVAEFQRLKQHASDRCARRAHFPCSKDGQEQIEKAKQSCYEKDFGCGHDCIDELVGQY